MTKIFGYIIVYSNESYLTRGEIDPSWFEFTNSPRAATFFECRDDAQNFINDYLNEAQSKKYKIKKAAIEYKIIIEN